MAQSKELQEFLYNHDEPLAKRIKVADNAFRIPNLSIHNKEELILKWALSLSEDKNSYRENIDIWEFIIKWLSTDQFRGLTINEFVADDIPIMLKLFKKKIQESEGDKQLRKKDIDLSVSLLLEHKVFCQYFKHNLKCYFKFLSMILTAADSPAGFIRLLKTPYLLSKYFIEQEKYCKYFLKFLFGTLAESIIKFDDDDKLLDEITTTVYKCIFQENTKHIEQHFLAASNDKKNNVIEEVLKYLTTVSWLDLKFAQTSFKLILNALSKCFNNSISCYRLLIYVLQILNFDISSDFKPVNTLRNDSLPISTSLQLLFVCLDAISAKHFVECEISKVTFTVFLRKIVKSLIVLQIPSKIVYEIFLKCTAISPFAIEPIVNDIIVFAIFANNEHRMNEYEQVIIEMFRIFAKLHRTENFLAKLIPSLRIALEGQYHIQDIENVYSTSGVKDVDRTSPNDVHVCVCTTFTENILKSFSNSINELISWQIINVMKTLLYHLNAAVTDFAENNKEDTNFLVFLEILGTFISQFLQTVRLADHNTPQSVLEKFLPCLNELNDILKIFRSAILKREHNHITMRTFLLISYRWAEIYMTIRYYSTNQIANLEKLNGNAHLTIGIPNYNLYMTNRKWKLIIQRITNFGQQQSKSLLHKLYIQRLKGIYLFEKDNEKTIEMSILTIFKTRLVDIWNEMISDKFSVDFLIPKLNTSSLLLLAEHVIENELYNELHIKDSVILINAIVYVTTSKINKYLKPKRKLDREQTIATATRFFAAIPIEMFFNAEAECDVEEANNTLKKLCEALHPNSSLTNHCSESREKIITKYLKVFNRFPIVYGFEIVQKISLIYLYFLYRDLINGSDEFKKNCENIIIGLLQYCKFNLLDVFDITFLCETTLKHFQRFNILFELIIDNVFKSEVSIKKLQLYIRCFDRKLDEPKYLDASVLIIQAANKIKKSKMPQPLKQLANEYKDALLCQISDIVCQSSYFIEAYAICLKHYLITENNEEILEKLLIKLPAYIDYSVKNISVSNESGCIVLFTTILNNKQRLNLDDDLISQIWDACKTVGIKDESINLVMLIVTLIPNEKYQLLLNDLLCCTKQSIVEKDNKSLLLHLKTWQSILTSCNVNPLKMKMWQHALRKCVDALLDLLKDNDCNTVILQTIVYLEESIIESQHLILSPALIDMLITSVTVIMQLNSNNFEDKYNQSICILEKLLKYRTAMILDRLPIFLLQYKILLKALCSKCDANPNSNSIDSDRGADCAHRLEKLTTNLISHKTDYSRISVYTIADILERYEEIYLYPNVKIHLNNCIYNLISLCDRHSISYLMRALPPASTEMFKTYYEHYKKYYKYTGKI